MAQNIDNSETLSFRVEMEVSVTVPKQKCVVDTEVKARELIEKKLEEVCCPEFAVSVSNVELGDDYYDEDIEPDDYDEDYEDDLYEDDKDFMISRDDRM